MKYKFDLLPNSLPILTITMPSLTSATLMVWVRTGSRYEEKRVNGISHFLEHMSFKGSKKRSSAKAISQALDAIGGEYNASTSKDWTNFYIKARNDQIETSFDILSDMLINPILKDGEIEKEKDVIVEEINMIEDTPMHRIWDVFESLIFEGSPLSWYITGVEGTVKIIRRADFLSYRKSHYRPNNMLITVAGGVSESRVEKLANKYFGKLKGSKLESEEESSSELQDKPRLILHPKKKDQAHFVLGFRADGRKYKGRYAQSVLSVILGGGMSSRLFTEVREKRGLAYAVWSHIERYQDSGYLACYAGVDLKRIEEALKITLDQYYNLANGSKNLVKPKELKKAKEYIKGHMALSLEDTKNVDEFFGERQLFLGKVETIENIFAKIDKVTLSDISYEAKRLFVPGGLNVALIGPYNDQNRLERIIK